MTRKEVMKDVDRRINGGESKRSVYSTYSMTEWEPVAVKRLAMLVTLTSRKKWRWLNNVLAGLYSVMLVMNVIAVVATESGSVAVSVICFLDEEGGSDDGSSK